MTELLNTAETTEHNNSQNYAAVSTGRFSIVIFTKSLSDNFLLASRISIPTICLFSSRSIVTPSSISKLLMHKLIKPHGRHSGPDPESSDFKGNVTGYRLSPV
jgi:hypothetical protein